MEKKLLMDMHVYASIPECLIVLSRAIPPLKMVCQRLVRLLEKGRMFLLIEGGWVDGSRAYYYAGFLLPPSFFLFFSISGILLDPKRGIQCLRLAATRSVRDMEHSIRERGRERYDLSLSWGKRGRQGRPSTLPPSLAFTETFVYDKPTQNCTKRCLILHPPSSLFGARHTWQIEIWE